MAWSGERLGRLVAQEHELLAGPARGRLTPLSTTASGDPRLTGHATGFWAMWSDTRDDDSLACVRLQQCTPEYYGAVMAPDGSVRSGPLRLTELAIPEPFVPITPASSAPKYSTTSPPSSRWASRRANWTITATL